MGSGGEMLKIDKTPEPAFFKKVRENPRIRRWDDVPHEGRDRLKRHILDCEQSHNRTYLCSYCERKVRPETTHIDHGAGSRS